MNTSKVEDHGNESSPNKCEPLKWRGEFARIRLPADRRDNYKLVRCIIWYAVGLLGALLLLAVPGEGFAIGLVRLVGLLWLVTCGYCGILSGKGVIIQTVRSRLHQITGPLHFFCPHCGMDVASNVEWRCGYCKNENRRTNAFSFLYRCERCDAAPKAYRCHHCEEAIFLDDDKDDKHIATIYVEPTPEIAKPVAQSRQEELEDIQFRTTRARMNTELALAEKNWKATQAQNRELKRSTGSKLEQSFEAHWNRNFEVQAIAEKNLKKVEHEHADNPEMLRKGQMAIQNWVAEVLGNV